VLRTVLFGGARVKPSCRSPAFGGVVVTMGALRFPFFAPRPRLYRSSSLEIDGISVGRKNKDIFWLSRRIVILYLAPSYLMKFVGVEINNCTCFQLLSTVRSVESYVLPT
jgi:hypothetical protein